MNSLNLQMCFSNNKIKRNMYMKSHQLSKKPTFLTASQICHFYVISRHHGDLIWTWGRVTKLIYVVLPWERHA